MKERLHKWLGVLGLLILTASLLIAFFMEGRKFYTLFLLGSWMVLDYLNYRVIGSSLISYLMEKSHHYLIAVLMLMNSLFAFIVDYAYGVSIVGMWRWPHYGWLDWVFMLGFMTLFFCFVVYETFRLFQFLLSKEFHLKTKRRKHKILDKSLIYLGMVFLAIPLVNYFWLSNAYGNYLMIFAFIGIWFVCDSIAGYLGRETVMDMIIDGDKAAIFGILGAALFLAVTHEFVNYFAGEWKYVNAPFHNVMIGNVPVSVLVGWIPLVIFCIALINLVKALPSKIKD
ncbi:MAG: hypothetical protein V1906_01030 [Candidatus Woesearchaeota archaeon]